MNNLPDDAQGVKHTPGPWILDGKRAVYHVHRPNGAIRDICVMAGDITEQRLVDARLIAAAPDLLDTLYAVKFTLESVKPSTTVGELLDLWHEVNAAIAKAEGQS